MLRLSAIVAGLLVSVSALATPAELVGTWAEACMNAGAPNQYMQSVIEFKADGTAINTVTGYTDAACTAAVGNQVQNATYTATNTEVRLLANINGHNYDLTLGYTIAGDVLTMTPTALKVDGADQNVASAEPAVMKRK